MIQIQWSRYKDPDDSHLGTRSARKLVVHKTQTLSLCDITIRSGYNTIHTWYSTVLYYYAVMLWQDVLQCLMGFLCPSEIIWTYIIIAHVIDIRISSRITRAYTPDIHHNILAGQPKTIIFKHSNDLKLEKCWSTIFNLYM